MHGPKFGPLQVNYLKKLGSSYDGNSPRNWEEADHNIFTVMQRLRGEVLENPYPNLYLLFFFGIKIPFFYFDKPGSLASRVRYCTELSPCPHVNMVAWSVVITINKSFKIIN